METKEIEGYEGLYSVREDGEVISFSRPGSRGGFLKPFPHRSSGDSQLTVGLWKMGSKKQFSVKALIAKAFIPNPDSHKCIRCIDSNEENTHVNNLEWVDCQEVASKYNPNK